MAATAAEGHRASPHQRARRYHQLHFLRPRPPAPCLRRRQAQGHDPRAARAEGRKIPRARRQDLRGRRRHVRHRRRSRRARAWRGDRRRGHGRDRGDHQRLHRVGLFRSQAHGAHGAEARHPVRRALPLRARRRSRFRGAGARARHRSRAEAVRRSGEQDHRRGQAAEAQQAVQIRSRPGQAALGARSRRRARSSGCSARSASRSTARESSSRRRLPRGAPTSPAPPISSRRWCGSPASMPFPPRRCAGRGRGKAGAHRGAEAAAARAARARGARACRGGDLVVHSARACGAVRRRRARAQLEQSDLDRACSDAALAPSRH